MNEVWLIGTFSDKYVTSASCGSRLRCDHDCEKSCCYLYRLPKKLLWWLSKLSEIPGDLISPVFYPSLPYSCVIEASANNEDCTALTCFTDGSKKESGETGAGVDFPRGGMSDILRPLGWYPTVFQAEVLAITLAAERLAEYPESHMTEETIFSSDSRATIQAICWSRVRSSSVHQCA